VDKSLGLPQPTDPFIYGRDLDYPMACNDRLGCCTIAGAIHMAQVQASIVGQTYTYLGDAVTESVYFGLTGGQDTGLELTQVLQYLSQPNDLQYQIVGVASVDVSDFNLVTTALYNFGALYLALNLPAGAESDFAKGLPWRFPAGQSVGGHCVVASGESVQVLSEKVTWAKTLDTLTWAQITEQTQDFFEAYCLQAFVVVPQWYVAANHDAVQNLDQSAMLADIQTIGKAR
jgi:hypothetical protein